MNRNLVITLILLVASCHTLNAASKPNILLIYSDDHGWADLGIQGSDKDIRTPHLDQMARDGVRFTRGYVTAPQCVPSRAGLMTGRYQQRFGVEDNSHGPLPLKELTIAERLQEAGYKTGQVGKWHLDISPGKGVGNAFRVLPEHMPHRQGFEEYFRGELRQFYASHDLQGRPFINAPHLVTDNRFRVTVQTEAALSFLDRRKAAPEQPWFLYLAWYAPHVPLESPEPWFSKTPENLPLQRRQALAMIAAMDEGLGKIREKLRELKQDQNTLIFFIGDNGAPLGNAWNGSVNLPMVGQKGMVAEGGVRVPFLATWPGQLPAGTIYDQPVISLDVAATAVALAGRPKDSALDGVNLVPYITGEKKEPPHENLFWRWSSQSAILEMPYKLIKLGNRPPLLFDLRKPDGENLERNLSMKHPDIVARLEQRLQSWAAELQPRGLSTDNSTFSKHHEEMFAQHRLIDSAAKTSKPGTLHETATEKKLKGWIARNGELSIRDGAMVLAVPEKPESKLRPFITNSSLDFQAPESIVLRIRWKGDAKKPGMITWRTRQQSFEPGQKADFKLQQSGEWQDLKLPLNEKAPIIHLRIHPPASFTSFEIQSIKLVSKDGRESVFQFK
ncbi:MAG: sulfatase [Gemmataceae bacterium]